MILIQGYWILNGHRGEQVKKPRLILNREKLEEYRERLRIEHRADINFMIKEASK